MARLVDIWKYDLRRGNTDHPRNGACLFDAAMWLVYGKIGDNPPCSCPIIRRYAIGLNDGFGDDQRQLLKPFILRVVGNRDPASEGARLRFIVLETARRVVPLALDRRWPEMAAQLRAIPEDISFAALRSQLKRARTAAGSAAAYAAAGSAAAYAAACAADAASNLAYAAVAAIDVSAAAYAASAAGTAALESLWILDNVLRIGKQSPELDETEIRRGVAAFEQAGVEA